MSIPTPVPGPPGRLHIVSDLLCYLLEQLRGILLLVSDPTWQDEHMAGQRDCLGLPHLYQLEPVLGQRDRLGLSHLYQLEPVLECLSVADLSPWQGSEPARLVTRLLDLSRPWLDGQVGPFEAWQAVAAAAVTWRTDTDGLLRVVQERTHMLGGSRPADNDSPAGGDESRKCPRFSAAVERLRQLRPENKPSAAKLDMLAERLAELGSALREQGVGWLVERLRLGSPLEEQARALYRLAVTSDLPTVRAALGEALRPEGSDPFRASQLQVLLVDELLNRLVWWYSWTGAVEQLAPTAPAPREHVAASAPKSLRWDEVTRTLLLDGIGIKTFRKNPANRQVELIEAFNRQSWNNPLINPFETPVILRQTCKSLNEGLPPQTVKFRMDGTGEGVRWERDR
jgi:hypothetical protein